MDTVATSSSLLSQVKSVRSPNVVLAGTMLRVSVSVSPMATRWVSGMVKSCTGAMTVTWMVSRVSEPSLAVTVMVTVPGLRPVTLAMPSSPTATVAMELLEEVQVNVWAMFSLEPFIS